jgi:hypothetical protein
MSPTPTQPMKVANGPTHEEICKRAYEKWCKRGRPDGYHLQDWLEAEAELKREFGMPTMAPARR